MSNVDVVRDAPRRPTLPVDDSVKIPDSVKRGAQIAESLHAQNYSKPADATAPAASAEPAAQAAAPAEPPATPAADAGAPAAAAPAAPASPAPVAAPVETPIPSRDDLQNDTWAGRYNSMRGRWEQSQQTIGQMQEQMSQMADELTRLHSMLAGRGQEPAPVQGSVQTPQQPQQPQFIRPEDVEQYGTDMVDMARRAALDAVSPEINALKTENQQLKQRVAQTTQRTVLQELTEAIPNWREINDSAQFKQWVRLRDVYSGNVRLQMLNEAYRQADASRVVAFFKGFIEAHPPAAPTPAPQTVQPATPQPAPRQAAVTLDVLAAPGRARPAPGQTEVPADKPIFTHAQIRQFYDAVRAGRFIGRETEKSAQEREIFAAQREGRIRG